jgi:Zn ribbon nucleic-acid-binding protein
MRCDWCARHDSLPLYEEEDWIVFSIPRCPNCGATTEQTPLEVAA